MATEYDITGYYKGEGLRFTAALKNRDGTVISTPGSQVVTLRFSNTIGGDALVEFSDTPDVTLSDAGTGTWSFDIDPDDLSLLLENRRYHYNIWTQLGSDAPILQILGTIRLKSSIEG